MHLEITITTIGEKGVPLQRAKPTHLFIYDDRYYNYYYYYYYY